MIKAQRTQNRVNLIGKVTLYPGCLFFIPLSSFKKTDIFFIQIRNKLFI